MNRMFDDIRAYTDEEIAPAMHRITGNIYFPVLAAFVFPNKSVDEVKELLLSIDTIHDFQTKVMYNVNLRIMEQSVEEFSCNGLENISREENYLYISNHRDIMLDASLLQNVLVDNGFDTTEITFGANLMQNSLVIDIGKANKMFRVERPGGGMRDFYKASKHLSEYIKHTILNKRESVWIAQRNGRTKDGIDRTDQGIINMLRMSGSNDKVKSITDFNIIPVSVSYEWEPCDVLKSLEMYSSRDSYYKKKEGEDFNSILTGIVQPKGRVCFNLSRRIEEKELLPYMHLSSGDFNKQVAAIIDKRICKSYHLWPNNYIAHDILSGSSAYVSMYSDEQKCAFEKYLSRLDNFSGEYDIETLRRIFLGIYANPVNSMLLYEADN